MSKKGIFSIVLGVIVLFLLILGNPVVFVSSGHRGVVTTMGAVQNRILQEGISIVTPFIDSVKEISVQVRKFDIATGAASKDLQTVTTKVTLNYYLDPDGVNWIYQKLGMGFEKTIIEPNILETVKAVTARYTAEELVTKREIVKKEITNEVQLYLSGNKIITSNLSIADFSFNPEFDKAVERKVTAEQRAKESLNDLERIKTEAQQAIETAMGEAKAIKIKGDALKENPSLISLEAVKKWDGKMPQFVGGNGPLPFLDLKK